MIYGYARISTKTQKLERQIKNLQEYSQNIIIHKEAYTGTSITRPEWIKLQRKLKAGDTLVFDSVSRMSRDAKEGIKKYFHLREARARGSQIGRREGKKVQTQKEKEMLPKIRKMARKFGGNMKDSEVVEILRIDRKTYYKYCKLIKAVLFKGLLLILNTLIFVLY